MDLFVDSRACTPNVVHTYLKIVVNELIAVDKALDALPLCALNLYFAEIILQNDSLFAESVISKVFVFVNLGLMGEAINRLLKLAKGMLLLPCNHGSFVSNLPSSISVFSVKDSLLDSINWDLLVDLAEISMSNRLKAIYGDETCSQFDICRSFVIQKVLSLYFSNDKMSCNSLNFTFELSSNESPQQERQIGRRIGDIEFLESGLRHRKFWFTQALQSRTASNSTKQHESLELDSPKTAPSMKPTIAHVSKKALDIALRHFSLLKECISNKKKNIENSVLKFVTIALLASDCYILDNSLLQSFIM
jgi:hypothetical protein